MANRGKPGTGIAAAATMHLLRSCLHAGHDENIFTLTLYCGSAQLLQLRSGSFWVNTDP